MGAEAAAAAELVVSQSIHPVPATADTIVLDLSSQLVLDVKSPPETPVAIQFVPSIRSGSFSDIGPRRYMEDEHIRIDDLSTHLHRDAPKPLAFYGVFDGHGGPEAAAYVRKHAMRFFFGDANFPQSSDMGQDTFLVDVENCIRKGFLQADLALADDITVSPSSGTTAFVSLCWPIRFGPD